jgi:hypothetical protein
MRVFNYISKQVSLLGLSLFALSISMGAFAQAAPAEASKSKEAFLKLADCANVVRFDGESLYSGKGPYLDKFSGDRKKIPATLDLVPLLTPLAPISLATLDGVVGIERIGTSLYVLTYSGIEEWDLSAHERVAVYPTHNLSRELGYHEHATGLVQFDGLLFISHGRLGLSIFDPNAKRVISLEGLVPSQRPLESQAVDIALSGSTALIAMDNFSMVKEGKPALRGFVVYDLKARRVLKEVEGLDPGATSIAISGSTVIVGFDGPIWKFDIKSIVNGGKSVKPARMIYQYPIKGEPRGKPVLDETNLYTCFRTSTETQGGPHAMVPEVWERSVLGL